jgi:predicted nucleic acid-binding protein
MNLVIDTSAIIAVITSEPEQAALEAATANAELLGPASIPWEIGNAFSAMLKRRRIDLPQAQAAMALYEQIPIRLVEVDLHAALEISAALELYAYDAYMIACAKAERCPLLTLDRGLIHAAKLAGITVLEVKQ